MQSNNEADRRPDRVKRVQDKSVTALAVEPWVGILKGVAGASREMAVFAYYLLLAYVLPALILSGLVVGGVALYFTLTGFA